MRRPRSLLGPAALLMAVTSFAADAPTRPEPAASFPEIAILAYHDVTSEPGSDAHAVTPEDLRDQLRACREQGWTFVPLSRLMELREHPEQLPARTLVVTFDDGYQSFVDQALPVLRAEGIVPTWAPITSYVGAPRADMPRLADWDEIRELAASGDVELASHSHALHQYETSSPMGVSEASVAVRKWQAATRTYEDREHYRARIGEDLQRTQRAFREEVGRPVRSLVWPYGAHNEMARAQAALAGFDVTLALEHRLVTASDLRSGCLPRFLVHRGLRFARNPDWYRTPPPTVRMAAVELDEMWNAEPAVLRQRLDEAVTRARAVGANHVMIPVFARPQRDGRLRGMYAMNHQAPVLADVWAYAAGRFRQAGFRVWAVVPVLNLTWVWDQEPDLRLGMRGWPAHDARWSTRLSPDLAGTRRAARDLVTDVAVYLPVDGIVFDDDCALPPQARLAVSGSQDPQRKSAAVRALLEDCKQAVRAWRPECRFGRVTPQGVVELPGVNREHAMNLEDSYTGDEWVLTPLAPPARGGSPASLSAATERLARRASERWFRLGRGGEAPIVFMVPGRDPVNGREVPAAHQLAMAHALKRAGLVHGGSLAPLAGGEMPLGLLESRPEPPAAQAAGRRRRD